MINDRFKKGFLICSLLIIASSCDYNKPKKNYNTDKENLIIGNKSDAKLLVSASENYLRLIDYCNFLKDTVVEDYHEEVLIDSIATKIALITKDLETISSKELILLPTINEVKPIEKKSIVDGEIKKNKKLFYQKLNTMIVDQINVLNSLDNKSVNKSILTLANESKNVLTSYNKKVEKLIK
jgi:hypothetical protein